MSGLPESLDWKTLYDTAEVEKLPWFSAQLDPDIEEYLSNEVPPGSSVLDLGTGPGTQAVELALQGYLVTGTDISPGAVCYARELAQKMGARATFLVDDILRSELATSFDAVVDRGCFHVLPVDRRDLYIKYVAGLVRPRGWFVLKCFCPAETRPGGPHRIAKEELEKRFSPILDRIVITETVYQGTLSPPPKAYLMTGMRKGKR